MANGNFSGGYVPRNDHVYLEVLLPLPGPLGHLVDQLDEVVGDAEHVLPVDAEELDADVEGGAHLVRDRRKGTAINRYGDI